MINRNKHMEHEEYRMGKVGECPTCKGREEVAVFWSGGITGYRPCGDCICPTCSHPFKGLGVARASEGLVVCPDPRHEEFQEGRVNPKVIQDKLTNHTELFSDIPAAIRVTFEDSTGTAIPLKQLAPRLADEMSGPEWPKLHIEVVYRDETGTFFPLDHAALSRDKDEELLAELAALSDWLYSVPENMIHKKIYERIATIRSRLEKNQ